MQKYQIINLESAKGKTLNGKICQILQKNEKNEQKDQRISVQLIQNKDGTTYRIKPQNIKPINFNVPIIQERIGAEAQKTTKQFLIRHKLEATDIGKDLVTSWLKQNHLKKCYFQNQAIALLTKNDFDPEKKHKDPWTINYVYTIPKERKKGKALQLLKQIKLKEQTSAMCCLSEGSPELFAKAGFIKGKFQPMPEMVLVYRYP